MPSIRVDKFLGKTPKLAAEHLPAAGAVEAVNVKLSSGEIVGRPTPAVAGNSGLTGAETKTLYALRDPTTDAPVWLAWTGDVDVAAPIDAAVASAQRFYYTGDTAPRVSTYALATKTPTPYPTDYYALGLPLPTAKPVATATTFTTKTTASYARDASGTVTIVTSAAHGLKDGAFVSVSGFTSVTGTYSQTGATITVTITNHGLQTGASVYLRFTTGSATANVFTVDTVVDANTFTVVASVTASTSGDVSWDITNLNATSVEVTVVDSTTFTYYSPGFEVATTTSSAGRVDIAGATQARTYVYTWYTPWSEESVASDPSDPLFIKEGQGATVSGLPTAPPAGKTHIRGLRLYRTLTSSTSTEYFRLATLWFPTSLARVSRTANVSRVTTVDEHNLAVGGHFKIAGCSDATFDIAGGVVTDVIDDFTFEYAQTAADVADTAATGTLYHDVSEVPGTSTPVYWGETSYDFTDDFAVTSLLNILASNEYDPPPSTLLGLTVFGNNVLAGFVDNEVYFSEPGQYHAWPRSYKKSLPYKVVALIALSGYLLVLTDSYPYLISGTDPAVLSVTRIDALYPCLSKASVVSTGAGALYASHDGLVLYSPSTGPQIVTKGVISPDVWRTTVDVHAMRSAYYEGEYLAWYDTSGGGVAGFSFYQYAQDGAYMVDLTVPNTPTALWYDSHTSSLYFASGTAGDVYVWEADTAQPTLSWTWRSKDLQVPTPICPGAIQVDMVGVLASSTLTLYADDTQVLSVLVSSSSPMVRAPAGYKADRLSVKLEGTDAKIRAIRLAETPTGLKEV